MDSHTPRALVSLEEFLATDFDYLVVGGGTAGLVVAARLSEDPSVQVGVLEAGSAHLDDQTILVPAAFAATIENPEYDWGLKTTPQAGTHQVCHSFPRGKVLGGSSAINYMMYVRGQVGEYDDWNKLTGYSKWDWKSLKPYFPKHEGFHGPASDQKGDELTFRLSKAHHGDTGPIRTSFPTWGPPVEKDWHRAAKSLDIGWKVPDDAWSGHNIGGYTNLATIDRSSGSGTRSYATSAYFLPNGDRANLKVLVDATTLRVDLEPTHDARVRATGITFMKDDKVFSKTVKKEVILSAGVVHTPQLLELSGIGRRDRLSDLGIHTFMENNQVGEGLEDHACTSITYEVDKDVFTNEWLSREDVMKKANEDYENGNGGPMANPIGNTAFLPLIQIATADEMKAILEVIAQTPQDDNPLIRAQHDLLVQRLQDPNTASIQLTMLTGGIDSSQAASQQKIFTKGTNAISVMIVLTHPFSRGSIHTISTDNKLQPQINPNYLSHPVDTLMLCVGLRVANDIFLSSPMQEHLVRRITPPPEIDMSNDTESLKEYVHGHTVTSYHPIGTAALGQVVDEDLRVLGTDGLRIVDASVFPLHVSGNIVGSVYAVAERGADLIQRNHGSIIVK